MGFFFGGTIVKNKHAIIMQEMKTENMRVYLKFRFDNEEDK